MKLFRYLRWLLLLCPLCPGLVTAGNPVPAVTIGQNFTGSTLLVNNFDGIPPDPNGAIGPRHFVEFINGNFNVYNRTNGHSVKSIADDKFWANAGVVLANSDTLSDPRIVYDPSVQRWFASEIDFDGNAAANGLDPTLEANDFLIAVSVNSDPTGSWHGFLFQADPDNGNFADFPTLGVDGVAAYLSGDMYHGSTNELGASLVSIPKSDLLAASPTVANRTWFGVMAFAERGQVLQPVNCWDGSVTGNILAPTDIGNDSSPHSNLVSFAVLNGASAAATLSSSTFIPTAPWVVPDNPYLGVPSFAPVQPDGTDTLQANEARFSSKVVGVGGVLYAAQNTQLNGHIAIRWYRVRAADNTLLESGTVVDPNLDLFFPSIAANAYGVVVLCFNASGASSSIGCYAQVGQTINGVTSFGDRVLLQSSSTSYHDLYEELGFTQTSRWGDYSTTSVDPTDPNRFWTIQMYPSNSDIWSTQITELITAPQILLSIALAKPSVILSWPAGPVNYGLQSVANLPPSASWSNVVQAPVTNGSLVSVTLPASAAHQFFRLQKQ